MSRQTLSSVAYRPFRQGKREPSLSQWLSLISGARQRRSGMDSQLQTALVDHILQLELALDLPGSDTRDKLYFLVVERNGRRLRECEQHRTILVAVDLFREDGCLVIAAEISRGFQAIERIVVAAAAIVIVAIRVPSIAAASAGWQAFRQSEQRDHVPRRWGGQ